MGPERVPAIDDEYIVFGGDSSIHDSEDDDAGGTLSGRAGN